jgi:hypothetical protein
MPRDFGKKLKFKLGDVKIRVRGDLTAVVWNDKQNVHMLTNVHHPRVYSNCCGGQP